MKCEKCGTDADDRTTTVYYGQIITQSTKSSQKSPGITTEVTTKTYRNILNEDIHICNECLTKRNRNQTILTPIWILLPLLFFWVPFMFGEGNLALSIICNVIPGGIMLVVIIMTIVRLRKQSYKDVSKFDTYPYAKRLLKKRLRKRNPKSRYSFWRSYPKNLKQVRY